MSVIVQLYYGESVEVKDNQMNFILFIHNRKNCSKSIVRDIIFHNKLSIRDLVYKDKSKDECFL